MTGNTPEHIFKVKEENSRQRLDVFLSRQLNGIVSRTGIRGLIESGHITVNGQRVKVPYKLRVDDQVMVTLVPREGPVPENILPENIPLDIFYEDGDLLVVNKPVGMMAHPAKGFYSRTLVNALLFYCRESGRTLSDVNTRERPGIVHRLDRETSGLLVVAKNNVVHVRLARQFEKHRVWKKYAALVSGDVAFDEGVIEVPLGRHPTHREKKAVTYEEGSREAVTYYRVVQRFGRDFCRVALFPKSGRTHQLRVHMAYLGHPILGDDKYGDKRCFPRLALHAQGLGFTHPQSKKWLEFSCPLPAEFLNPQDLFKG